ncbi:hypothetical protein PIB30_088208 [Stylosanthes scabra]|uniref:Uncharacterized protein n=1 Tax=Stylosanthes scabra TaxID=79078 RepID=A0ABU6UWD8_9FABA|nr:hypothetical protein [Stylosanthes scabra]
MTTLEFVQTTTTFIEEARTNFRNQESAIRNLETQMGQMAGQFSTPLPNAFPSNTMEWKALQNSKQEGMNKEDVKGTPTKPPKEEIVINATQCPEEEDEEWCMRMDVIEGLNREVQQEEAMQEFQAKQGRYDVLDDTNQDFVMQELDAIVQKNIAEMQQEHLELQPPRVDEVQPNNVKMQQQNHDSLQQKNNGKVQRKTKYATLKGKTNHDAKLITHYPQICISRKCQKSDLSMQDTD